MGCTSSNNKNNINDSEPQNDILTEEFKQDLEEQINQFLMHKKPICIGFILEDKNKHTLKEKFLAICRHIICAISILNLSIVPCSKKWLKPHTTIHTDLKENINLYLTIKFPESIETNQKYSSSDISYSFKSDTSNSLKTDLIIPPAPSLQTSYGESEICLKTLTRTDTSNDIFTTTKDNINNSTNGIISDSLNKLEIMTKEDSISKVKRWLLDNYSLYSSHLIRENSIFPNLYFENNNTFCNDCCSNSANCASSNIYSECLNSFICSPNPLSDKLLQNLPLEFCRKKYSHSLTNSIVSLKKICEINQEIYIDSNYIVHQHFHEHHHYFHYD